MSEQQPDVRWAPLPPAPKRRGRAWLIVGIVVAILVVAAVLLLFLVPRGATPAPSPSPTPSVSSTTTPSPTPSASPTPTTSETPVASPTPTDPDLPAFTAQVRPRLDDAVTGLRLADGMSGSDAVQVVDQLQQDADRLSDTVAPSSISAAWYEDVATYSARLQDLRTAYENGGDVQSARGAVQESLDGLRALAGL